MLVPCCWSRSSPLTPGRFCGKVAVPGPHVPGDSRVRHPGPHSVPFPQVRALWDPLHRRRLPGLQGLFCGPSQGHRVGKGQGRAPLSQGPGQGQLGPRACGGSPVPSSPLSLQSISGSDWLNTVAAGDITGELVAAVLPDLAVNPLNIKRSSDRRFVRDHRSWGPAQHTGPAGAGDTGEMSWAPIPALPVCRGAAGPAPALP